MNLMTSKQKEFAARALCESRGIYWNTSVPHGAAPNPDGSANLVLLHSTAWQLALIEIEDYERIELALLAGRSSDA